MGRILCFLLALAVLFAADHILGEPQWFNDPRHFLGGFLAALLVGACWERGKYESFRASWPFVLFAGIIAGAMLLGLAVEFKEYLWDNPQLIASGPAAMEMIYHDTYRDLFMDLVGAFTGAADYLLLRYPR